MLVLGRGIEYDLWTAIDAKNGKPRKFGFGYKASAGPGNRIHGQDIIAFPAPNGAVFFMDPVVCGHIYGLYGVGMEHAGIGCGGTAGLAIDVTKMKDCSKSIADLFKEAERRGIFKKDGNYCDFVHDEPLTVPNL